MADNIGVAATGGKNADGSRWVSYDAGAGWFVETRSSSLVAGWAVTLLKNDEAVTSFPLLGRLSESAACLVAEAVAVAVGHVLAQGAAVEVEEEDSRGS